MLLLPFIFFFSSLGFYSTHSILPSLIPAAQDEQDALFASNFQDAAQICSLSSFNMYWILQALGNLGKYDFATAAVDMCWGGQIRLGATTYWEVYNNDWDDILQPNGPILNYQNGPTSLCHPWSSGVTTWLSKSLLGIKVRTQKSDFVS